MTVVRSSCPLCATSVEVPSTEVLVRLGAHPSTAWYCYRCPRCLKECTIRVNAVVATMLIDSGCSFVVPPIETHDMTLPPLTEDDLIEFGKALEAMT